jgi:multicomponent Na+:H+ antiporter subunit D
MLNEIASMSYLLGVALIYMITGHLNLERVATSLQSIWPLYSTNIIIAIGFMTIGVGIKAAIFPFHIWLPDAHATAPSTSSAILSGIVVKIYILVLVKLLFRVFGMEIVEALHIKWIMLILGSAGMIMGSIFAIAQKDVKRMLGYSSVAQIGYIILGIGLFTEAGLQAAFFHIISHGIMKAALFLSVGVIIYYKHVQKLKDFEGIGYQMPISMTVFSFGALGMVGIPLTSGFISKFNLGIAVIDANLIFFLIIIILSGLLNVVYYFPIVISAFLKDNKEMQKIPHIEKVPNIMLIPILTLGVAIVVLGLFPNLIMDIIVSVVATLF